MKSHILKIWRSRLFRSFVQFGFLAATVAGVEQAAHGFALPKPLFAALVLLLGNFYCGWGCPFGTVQDWLRRLGRRFFRFSLKLPAAAHRYLSLFRYIAPLLGLFALWGWLDSRRIFFGIFSGAEVAAAGLISMAVVIVLSLLMDRPFCKYLCPFGAIYGLVGMFRIVAVKRGDGCVGCRKCDRVCPMGVPVSKMRVVRDPRCINCRECVASCPKRDALGFGFALPRWRDFASVIRGETRDAADRLDSARSGEREAA